MSATRQFLRDVEWGSLDCLVVDLPPGTGDIPLTLAQEVPLSGGLIVTTPQDVALADVQRGVAMLRQVGIDTEWVVMGSDRPEFFQFTKRLHNLIHGSGEPTVSSAEREVYEQVSHENAKEFGGVVGPRDIVVVHDPRDYEQTLQPAHDLALHGHTHRLCEEHRNGTLIFNPGECAGHMQGLNAIGVVDLTTLETELLRF